MNKIKSIRPHNCYIKTLKYPWLDLEELATHGLLYKSVSIENFELFKSS